MMTKRFMARRFTARRFRFFILAGLMISAVSWAGIHVYAQAKKGRDRAKDDLYTQVELFADAVSAVRTDYVDDVEPKKMVYGALRGMLSSLDDFSQFMDPEEYKEVKVEAKGEFSGVGVEVSTKDGIITVIAPIAGGPAEAAGVRPGDRIVRIDGRITRDMTLNDAVKALRGQPGTAVTVTVWREKDQRILDIPIRRAVVKINSVKNAKIIEDRIGYIRLIEFQENTPRDLEEALKKLESGKMDSLILDLRNNPGGLLDVSIDVAEKFLPKDAPIVSMKSRTPGQNAVFKSSGNFRHPPYPLVVLVNEGSASASEIVAGALQDNKRAVILGAKTFGKGSVQTMIPLKDSSALKLTTASYFTPNGRMIRGQGIIPDVVVEREEAGPGDFEEGPVDIFEKLASEPPSGPRKGPPPSKKAPPDKRAPEKKTPAEEKIGRDSQLEKARDLIKTLRVYGAGK